MEKNFTATSSIDDRPAAGAEETGAAGAATVSGDDADLLDIRIALVLYGGVSLAIYENGVTRCFYELVKGKGVFPLLLRLREATAQVDVIAGTSAGGINGLLLAATLESGADFTESEELWRRLGDLGALMRDVKDSDGAQSLLKGETYYQDSLIEALRRYCTPPASKADDYPLEMDVFVTGTDLDGQERMNWDALGDPISDKEHRVVFHLEHRPNRKALGCGDRNKASADPDVQGTILGTIARITSSFPAAFPPFQLAHLDARHGQYKEAVRQALERTALSGLNRTADRSFVDGGLLDNKPFGPVLEAIFHRMPTGVVERRLFYVEPDPEPRPDPPDPKKHKPMSVGAASATIPSHESIWGDLRDLERHNAQVRWFRQFKQAWIDNIDTATSAVDPMRSIWAKPYWNTRIESLTRSLFLASDAATPSAADQIGNPAHRALAKGIAAALEPWTSPPEPQPEDPPPWPGTTRGPFLNSFDTDFHLRRSFHLLYSLSDRLCAAQATEAETTRCRAAMRLLGRVIKAQKIVRDLMLELRQQILAGVDRIGAQATADAGGRRAAQALYVVNLYRLFLDARAPHWAALVRECALTTERLRTFDSHWKSFLPTEALSNATNAARECAKDPALLARKAQERVGVANIEAALTTDDLSVRWTILDELERALRHVLDATLAHSGNTKDVNAVDRFMAVDLVTFPLAFASGMYELDDIKYVRISPQDAQTGFSKGEAKFKVAGDELFHFSAFLRKDWRANDIFIGRLDGICQIIHALLAPTLPTVLSVQRRLNELRPLFSAAVFDKDKGTAHGMECFAESWQALANHWAALEAALQDVRLPNGDGAEPFALPAPVEAAWKAFSRQLIQVGQEDAFLQSFPGILGDHYYQEMAFGASPDDLDTSSANGGSHPAPPPSKRADAFQPSSSTMLEAMAKKGATEHLDATPRREWWKLFKDMHLGGQPLNGGDGGVPPHISGEYVSQSYLLLWGMVHSSLGKTGQRVLDKKTVRMVLRHPLGFVNALFFLMRRSYITALATIATTAGLILGVAGTGYFLGGPRGGWLCAAASILLLLFMGFTSWVVPRNRTRPLRLALAPTSFLMIALVVAGAALAVSQNGRAWSDYFGAALGWPHGPVGFAAGIVAALACVFVPRRHREAAAPKPDGHRES